MKKIVLLMLFMFTASNLVAYAASDDELDDLDALLNEEDTGNTQQTTGDTQENTQEDTENTQEDTGNTQQTTGDTQENTQEDTENTQEDTGNTQQATGDNEAVGKVGLELSNNPTTGLVELLVTPVDDYTDYKVYYSKEGDDENVAETGFTINNGESKKVVISNLEGGATYKFVAKAFDNDGNPVEATTSDPVTVTIPENEKQSEQEQHAAPADNVIYNPVVKVEGNVIKITYKPGNDVKKVQISISDDGKVFKPVATIDATQTEYDIKVDKTGKKYIKIVPIAEDGTLGTCKIGATEVPFVTAKVEPKQKAQNNMGKPKTGPELYLLIIIAILAATAYSYRKRNA